MAAEVPPGFSFPSGATAPLAARVIRAIYADPGAIELLPYAISLDTQIRMRESADRAGMEPLPDRRVSSGRWLPTFSYPRWSGDVLVVGECRRDAEVALMARIVDGLVRTGRSVLYLSTSRTEHATMLRHRRDAGWGPRCALSRIATVGRDRLQYWLHRGAPAQMQRDTQALAVLLTAHDARMSPGATWTMREVATAKVQWQILKRRLSFRSGAITRTNYAPLSAALLADCFAGGQLSISLQHSIVTCPSSFSPLLPRRYLCFGDGSRAVLRQLDEELSAGAVQGGGSGCELVVAGSFLDPMPALAKPSASGTVMIVDQTSDWALPFYGGGREAFDSLFQLVTVLAGSAAVRRVLVRLHPTGDGERMWKEIARRFPDRVVLGPWQRPLQADLAEASVVVGLFSTVLATAAAAGLPTLFLWQPGWFYTPDLAPFSAQLVAPSAAVARIESLLLRPNRFAAESDTARAAGATYFNGRDCDFGSELLEHLLRPLIGATRGCV